MSAEHPGEAKLKAWLSFSLEENEAAEIEAHLQACQNCAQRLEGLEQPQDAFVERIRSMAQPALPPHEDRNLLFGVLALQLHLISEKQFVEACEIFLASADKGVWDVLADKGWLNEQGKRQVDELLDVTLETRVRTDTVQMPAAGADQESTVTLGPLDEEKIELKKVYSSGGLGRIWLARDQVVGRDIAVKELLPDKADSRQVRDRFHREARLTGQLEHPGIVPLYGYHRGADDGKSYYTMRFIKGRTLAEVIEAYHDLRDPQAKSVELIRLLHYFVSICNTLSYAHSRNVIHRDLKGDNIIVGDFGETVVLDWGLAKDLSPELSSLSRSDYAKTIQGERLGTPVYMAPEQAAGRIEEIDHRTDIYGLAAILYEILTGQPPFTGRTVLHILSKVECEAPTPPSKLNVNVPAELEAIVLQGLSKQREDRQQSAGDLGGQVQDWLARKSERKRTEQERERFFALSSDLLAIVDSDGNFAQLNPAWETLLGWSADQMQEHTLLTLSHPDDAESVASALREASEAQSSFEIENRCLRRDGSYRWIHWNANLMPEDASIYIVGRDIRSRKQAEQRFQDLLEAAPDAVVVVNAERKIVLVNEQTEQLFGHRRSQLIGKPIEVLLPRRYHKDHPAKFASFVERPHRRPMRSDLELYGRKADGSEFRVEISLGPLKTEDGPLFVSTIRDVSERSG